MCGKGHTCDNGISIDSISRAALPAFEEDVGLINQNNQSPKRSILKEVLQLSLVDIVAVNNLAQRYLEKSSPRYFGRGFYTCLSQPSVW